MTQTDTVLDVGQQWPFFIARDRYPALFGGRGSGKTKCLVLRMFTFAFENPGALQVLTEPTYQMAEQNLMPVIEREWGSSRGKAWDVRGVVGGGSGVIDFSNGAQIMIRASETPERFRGLELAAWGMDEAAIGHQEPAFLLLVPTLRQPGYEHHGWIATTPRGRNWLWRDWVNHETRKPAHAAFYATTRDNKHLSDEDIASWEAVYGNTSLAAQELEGKFIESRGQVHPQFSRGLHVREAPDHHSFKRRLGGIDFGGVSPTAVVAGGLAGDGRAWAYGEWYRHSATMDDLVAALVDQRERLGVTRWLADPAGKESIRQLRSFGFDVVLAPHGNRLETRAQLVGARLNKAPDGNPGCYISPACPNLISEIEGLAWRRVILPGRGEETMTDELERGLPDHAWDAWANILSELDAPQEFYGNIPNLTPKVTGWRR